MSTDSTPEPPERAFGPRLRFIEQLGYRACAAWVATLVVLGVAWGPPYTRVWELVLGQVAGGRAVSVSRGLDLGFSKWFLFFQCSFQDILLLLLLYPWIVAGYRRTVEMSFIGETLLNIRRTAEKHKEIVRPWGPIGLALFVLFPFWSTGALAGGVVGYLLGMRMWVVFAAVIIGNCVAVAIWIGLFDQMAALSSKAVGWMPWAILAIIAAVSAYFYVRKRLWPPAEELDEAAPPTSGETPPEEDAPDSAPAQADPQLEDEPAPQLAEDAPPTPSHTEPEPSQDGAAAPAQDQDAPRETPAVPGDGPSSHPPAM